VFGKSSDHEAAGADQAEWHAEHKDGAVAESLLESVGRVSSAAVGGIVVCQTIFAIRTCLTCFRRDQQQQGSQDWFCK